MFKKNKNINNINKKNKNINNINYFNLLRNEDDKINDVDTFKLDEVVMNDIKNKKIKYNIDETILNDYVDNISDDKWLSVINKKSKLKKNINNNNNIILDNKNNNLKNNNLDNLKNNNLDNLKDNNLDNKNNNLKNNNLDNLKDNNLDNLKDNNFNNLKDDGTDYKFNQKWCIWIHLTESDNWTPESYTNIYTINSIKSFWEFFGNIENLDLIKYQFFIMRENISPGWEHPLNRNGGICSIRIIKDKIIEIIEQIAILIINESFTDNPLDINGLSFSIKYNWGVIKIWNKTKTNDISNQCPNYMVKKYYFNPRYDINEPEY